MSIVVAALMFAILSSPPLLLLLLLGWLAGAETTLLVPVGVWLLATVWLAINAGARVKRQALLDALTDAPLDVAHQLARLLGIRRKGLRAI